MATIQIKRRTTAGTGPLVGTNGSIKAGEPLVDFNGGHLYIANNDKTASSSVPLFELDYMSIPSVDRVDDQIDVKINALSLGSASKKDTGTTSGCVPILDSNGKLVDSVIPKVALTNTFVVSSEPSMLALSTAQEGDVAVRTDLNKTYILKTTGYATLANWQEILTPTDKVQSVNGKSGTVTITLDELGGVSSTTFNSHTSSNTHLTSPQITKIANADNTRIQSEDGVGYIDLKADLTNLVIPEGIKIYSVVDDQYNPPRVYYYMGIDKTKVLQPSSVIDGGSY